MTTTTPQTPAKPRGADVARLERELAGDRALCERVLQTLPPVPAEPERVLRCSPENADRAIARALARAVVLGELTTIEIVGDGDVTNSENY